jgi:MFS family permease
MGLSIRLPANEPMTEPAQPASLPPSSVTLQIISIAFYTFIAFFSIGLPIAVLPGYVHDQLGFSAVAAGIVIGVQYLATLLSRPTAGRMADALGTKRTIVYGLIGIGISGVLTLASTLLQGVPQWSLGILIVGRVILGLSQGAIGVGTSSWGISRVGAEHMAKVISWNGIASYGAIAIGAPLGVIMVAALGFWTLGVALIALSGLALFMIRNTPPAPIVRGERMPFWAAFGRVAPHGAALMLASIGYGTLTTFITLYYVDQGWEGAAYCLTAFGACFIIARLVFINSIKHLGGFTVALACMATEALGLLLLWLAPSPLFTLIGAGLTGLGLSLVYPALGVVAIREVPSASRGAGLSAFAVFFDLALAIAGPVMGAVAALMGYASIFAIAALLSMVALALTWWLSRRDH